MNFPAADITAMLASSALGQAVTLHHGLTETPAQAFVELIDTAVEPLSGNNARLAFRLTMASSAAASLTPDWTVQVGGETRAVLETVDQGNGLSAVYLGDPIVGG